ncbi:hypothetical protein PbJCM17693_04060 [Paenibacillus macerans]|nr:hypothetical protein PbJCM17693_04060 [Paenibacillus macerans]
MGQAPFSVRPVSFKHDHRFHLQHMMKQVDFKAGGVLDKKKTKDEKNGRWDNYR